MKRLLAGATVFCAVWLPAATAGAANSPTFRDCAHTLEIDPDFVQLTGATVGPGGTLMVTSSQPSVTLVASESSLPGDNLNMVKFSVTSTSSGSTTRTVSGAAIGKVTLTVPLSGAAPGGQYSLNWSATFDNGTHPCPGATDPQNATESPFVLHVAAGPAPPAPVLTGLSESQRAWTERQGTKFSFMLDQPAQVLLRFSRKLHHHLQSKGALSVAGVAGTDSVDFHGTLPNAHGTGHHRLAPGQYVVMITAVNSNGGTSTPAVIGFTIKPPRH